MNWVRLGQYTFLEHVFPVFLPADHWAQVDIWIPYPMGDQGCNPFGGNTAYFLYQRAFVGPFGTGDGIAATFLNPDWRWTTSQNIPGASGPSPETTYTVAYHVHGSQIDWYVDGVLVLTDTLTGANAYNHLILNFTFQRCCCQATYYTNVKVGTSEGASDIFADDFSGGIDPTDWQILNSYSNYPLLLATVYPEPVQIGCPVVTVTPPSGQPTDAITISGTGFTPGAALTFYWNGQFDSNTVATADGSGAFTVATTVPEGIGTSDPEGVGPPLAHFTLLVLDTAFVVGCVQFDVCGGRDSDGILAQVDGDGFDTNTPDPVVAVGGVSDGFVELILDYIWHDGAHWVLWEDPSALSDNGTFPPPPNHTLNATRISADGSSVIDYPIDSDYAWSFGGGSDDDPGLFAFRDCGTFHANSPVWTHHTWFTNWQKPVYDARFASDGTNLWVGLVTAETVKYPWLDNLDAVPPNPGAASQYVPLDVLTSGHTNFATGPSGNGNYYLRYKTETYGAVGFWQPRAFPVTDGGIGTMGVWNPPKVIMYSFDGGAFDRVGDIPALYCPSVIQKTDGYANIFDGILGVPVQFNRASTGSIYSRVSLAASPSDPGVCHCVWSEGGDWGRVGDGDPCGDGSQHHYVWDAGPANRDYRVNYTKWTFTGKVFDNDIFYSHQDRTNWWFDWVEGSFEGHYGYTWPDQDNFSGLVCHDLRNDNLGGTPYLFASIPQSIQNAYFQSDDGHGHPWLDNDIVYGDTLHVYDLSSGSADEVRTLDLATLGPNAAEMAALWPDETSGFNVTSPLGTVDCLLGPSLALPSFNISVSIPPVSKAFGISIPYDDPNLGVPVYLVHVPLAKRYVEFVGPPPFSAINGSQTTLLGGRAFYRVPCDMSADFDYLDGVRDIGFTIVKYLFRGSASTDFGDGDFFSDPRNIWVPSIHDSGGIASGEPGYWFDRICLNQWENTTDAFTPGDFSIPDISVGWAACEGFHYDPDADSFTFVGSGTSAHGFPATLFNVQTLFICRGCRNCLCGGGTGVHIAHRF